MSASANTTNGLKSFATEHHAKVLGKQQEAKARWP